jgi:excisionase family DNA binding protein
MTMIADSSELLTPAEVAALLRVEVQTLSVWRCSGRGGLRFVRVGKSIRYRRADVLDFIERNSATSCAQLSAATA